MTKEFLIEEYKTKSIVKIAKENNITVFSLYKLFDKLQIKRRTQREAGAFRIVNHSCIDCGKQVSRKEYIRCISCEHKRKHKEYVCIECGNKISNGNGLTGKKRCLFCANKGENNPFHNKSHTEEHKRKMSLILGGTGIPYEHSDYPLIFNNELKEQIRKRDDYKCQNCGMTEEEHLTVIGKDLHVHHIDYNKQNCDKTNLIAVCASCNNRANFNRSYWQELYTNKINQIYLVDLEAKEK